jgi:3-dehydroquinate synthase
LLYTDIHITHSEHYRYNLAQNVLKHEKLDLQIANLASKKAIVLVDENVWSFHQMYIERCIINKFEGCLVELIPSGEASKNVQLFHELLEKILAFGIDRKTPQFAIGGGVSGDLAGYVAASVMRGIPLIHMPTTTLSMVDSSIGGKTGVNSKGGKNLIGAFYQPKAIFADTHFLSTLPMREMLCGISETIKHGMIAHEKLVYLTLKYLQNTKDNQELLTQLLFESAKVKMQIVQQDTLEKGVRAMLNLGHTFGHALEAAAGYGYILHGEAVFIGMVAAEYAASVVYKRPLYSWMDNFIPFYNEHMPKSVPSIDSLIPYMFNDKKNRNGRIHLILSPVIGQAELKEITDLNLLSASFEYAYGKLNLSARN